MSLFPSVFCTVSAFSLYGIYVVRPFLPNGVFLPAGFLTSSYVRIQSIDQSIRGKGCQSSSWSTGQDKIREASTKLQREHDNKNEKQGNNNPRHTPENDRRR